MGKENLLWVSRTLFPDPTIPGDFKRAKVKTNTLQIRKKNVCLVKQT